MKGDDISVAPFRVIIFSSVAPMELYLLMDRIEREVPGAEIAGLLYEARPGKTLSQRLKLWSKNLKQPGYIPYVLERMSNRAALVASRLGHAVLRFFQASAVVYRGATAMSLAELQRICQQRGWAMLVRQDIHGAESLQFVAQYKADLGIVMGTRILKPALYKIPRMGSINIHKRKVPDYCGGGAVGLWELLDGQTETAVTIHEVEEKVDTGAVLRAQRIPIDAYDSLASLGMKAAVVGEDLLVATVRDYVQGTLQRTSQTGPGRTYKAPKPHELRQFQKKLAELQPHYRVPQGRSTWKLVLRSSLFPLWLVWRNWRNRLRRSFPVVISYHHLVTDRRHPLGLPTEKFLAHLRYLKQHYQIVSLDEAVRLLKSGKVEQPTMVITLDDGYAENFLNLRAVLRAEPTPVTLFVCPALAEQGKAFPHDLGESREDFPSLSPEQLRFLAAHGIEIDSHTRTHFDCGARDRARLDEEIAGSKKDLEKILGRKVCYFAFPWGKAANISPEAAQLAAANYEHFLSAFGGFNHPAAAGYEHLKRISMPASLWELELAIQGVLNFGQDRIEVYS
jgi:peptidoglycan/xylan/chitin deacetylase (PgdA/CDA1 family)/folate-dependent phosphoribosylglycinamide formyltransferase PurN